MVGRWAPQARRRLSRLRRAGRALRGPLKADDRHLSIMGKILPPGDRSTVTDTADGLLIATPTRKVWFIIAFLPLWLMGWAFGAVTAGSELLQFKETQGESFLFLVVWLTLWLFFGFAALLLLMWTLFGIEKVLVTPGTFDIRREVFGLGFSREYDLSHARGLRVTSDSFSMFDPRMALRFWGFGGGPIAFDYGSSTVRFGSGMEEAEASRVVARILTRFGSLGRKNA